MQKTWRAPEKDLAHPRAIIYKNISTNPCAHRAQMKKREEMEINAKDPTSGREITLTKNFGKDLDESVELFGDAATHSAAVAHWVVGAQGIARNAIKGDDPKSQADAQKVMDDWTPGKRRVGKPKGERLKEEFDKLTPEDRKAFLAVLSGGGGKKEKAA